MIHTAPQVASTPGAAVLLVTRGGALWLGGLSLHSRVAGEVTQLVASGAPGFLVSQDDCGSFDTVSTAQTLKSFVSALTWYLAYLLSQSNKKRSIKPRMFDS